MENDVFKIAIVGRPNVGKSTLFNFLIGKNVALTSYFAGLTRDRKESVANLYDIKFTLIDTGGYDLQKGEINSLIWKQSQIAIQQADCILFVVDADSGVSPIDVYLANLLRKESKAVILVVNKIDTFVAKGNISSFYELGFKDICYISAVHSTGMQDLYNLLKPYVKLSKQEVIEKPILTLSFVGKPNVGKSTLINTLLKEDRLLTSNTAGTTRDSIYLDFVYQGKNIKIVDTAGLRRRSKVSMQTEKLANGDSIRTINFSTIVALVISAEEGLTKQDLTLAQNIVKEGRGLMIVINKIDLVAHKTLFIKKISETIEENFFQIKSPYIMAISALEDSNLTIILEKAFELYEKWQFIISTGKLNTWLQAVLVKNSPPIVKSKRLKIKYATQTKQRPPTISIWSNFNTEFPKSYLRYLQNEFYKSFNLWGCTLRFIVRKSNNPYANKIKK